MTRGFDPGAPPHHSHELAPEEVIRVKVKAELRKRLRGVRKTAPIEACAARSEKIIAALEKDSAIASAKAVALFWPIVARHEIDLRAFDATLRARSVRVAYPAINAGTDVMSFRFVDDPATMEELGYGFAEPPPDAPHADELDVVIVPAIAADPTGHRIGYGAGYYDRTLPSYAPPAVSICVIFDWQLVAEVPSTPTDVRVARIVTDERVLDASSA
jgi:5-formyltetrahydrofolate cyclo-ligase